VSSMPAARLRCGPLHSHSPVSADRSSDAPGGRRAPDPRMRCVAFEASITGIWQSSSTRSGRGRCVHAAPRPLACRRPVSTVRPWPQHGLRDEGFTSVVFHHQHLPPQRRLDNTVAADRLRGPGVPCTGSRPAPGLGKRRVRWKQGP